MKKIILIISAAIFISSMAGAQTILASCPVIKAAPATPADTLAWLQANIIQKSSYYIGKPFSVLMDTIQAHGMNMYNMDYLRAGGLINKSVESLSQFENGTYKL